MNYPTLPQTQRLSLEMLRRINALELGLAASTLRVEALEARLERIVGPLRDAFTDFADA